MVVVEGATLLSRSETKSRNARKEEENKSSADHNPHRGLRRSIRPISLGERSLISASLQGCSEIHAPIFRSLCHVLRRGVQARGRNESEADQEPADSNFGLGLALGLGIQRSRRLHGPCTSAWSLRPWQNSR